MCGPVQFFVCGDKYYIICSTVFSAIRVFIHICIYFVFNFRIVYLQSSRPCRRRRVPVSYPTAMRPLRSSRPLPTPRAQQQHQHDQYTSAAAPRFAATAAATTLLAPPNQAATLRPRSEVRSLYIPRRVRTPPARRFVSGG